MRGIAALAGALLVGGVMASLDARQALLVQAGDLRYEGAFRVPSGTNNGSTFDSGATALAYNATNNTLLAVGHPNQQMVAEMTIPTPSTASSASSLPQATFRTGFVDVLEGRRGSVGSGSGETIIGGLLLSGSSLIVSDYVFYDANGDQTLSHFRSGTNLTQSGDLQGPYSMQGRGAGFVSGYMAQIPPEWQTAFGASAFAGQCCVPILSRTSSGPAATAFNPANVTGSPIPATEVLGYPLDNPLPSPLFTKADEIHSMVVPNGTASALFFGRHGTGPICYGTGGTECNDPSSTDKGYHAYPYVYFVWAYNLNDMLAVKNGTKQPWSLRPYATWSLNLPFGSDGAWMDGAAYDASRNRIYLSVDSRIYAYTVGASGTTPPAPGSPTNVRIVR